MVMTLRMCAQRILARRWRGSSPPPPPGARAWCRTDTCAAARSWRTARGRSRRRCTSPHRSPAPGQDLGHLGRGLRGHLLDARHQHDVVQPGRHRRDGVKEGRPAGGAGRLKARGRDARDAHAPSPRRAPGGSGRRRTARRNCRDRTPPPATASRARSPDAFWPASTASERRSRSGNAPKAVFPMPMTATGLIAFRIAWARDAEVDTRLDRERLAKWTA